MSRAEQISRRLKLRHLNVLAAVAQWGSMAKAAEHLSITQPVVSKAIADLETMLGVRLLDRVPHGVEPTIYGRALLKRSVAIFDDLRTSVSEIEFLADPTIGELRIGAIGAITGGLLPVLIDRLARKYPRLAFEVVQADAAILKERELRERRIELAILRTEAHNRDEDLEETTLYSDRLSIVAGASSPWARRRKIKLAELADEPWCLPPPDHPVSLLVTEAFRRSGLEPPRSRMTAATPHFVSDLVAKGHFLGIHGSVYLRFSPASGALKVLPVDLPIPLAPISIVTLKNRTLSPIAQLFIDSAREITRPLTEK
jgi:DNA-binding transcriptional LysR family regulator